VHPCFLNQRLSSAAFTLNGNPLWLHCQGNGDVPYPRSKQFGNLLPLKSVTVAEAISSKLVASR
jgi:hypothetical protein